VSGILHVEKVGATIETNATYADKELMASIPGARFHSPPPIWTAPLSWAACQQLRGLFGDRLHVGPELKAWVRNELDTRISKSLRIRDNISGTKIPVDPPAGWRLRPYQEDDVAWMMAAGSGLLMTPTGGGKTPSTLTWMRNNAFDRVLVLCQANMRLDWAMEARRWYPELEPVPIIGTPAERRRLIQEVADYGGIAIVGLDSARTHSRLAPYGQVKLTEAEKRPKDLNHIVWDAVVCDEAHRLKDPKSKQTRAAWQLAHQQDCPRFGLTATPQTKGLDTLWSVLHFTDPDEWPSRSKFIDRYAMTSLSFWGAATVGALRPEMEKEFQAIFDPRSRRLPLDIILPQLPPITRIQREVEMAPEQKAAYDQMAKLSLASVMEQNVVVATSTAAQYTRLGQFASSYARVETRMVKNKETGELEPKDFVELEPPSCKIDALLVDLEDWIAQEESVIVFATSRKLIELTSETLKRKKIGHSKVVGGQRDMDRYEEIKRFQDAEVPVILVVIAAGGTGITLTRGRIMAFMQRSYSRVDDIQAEGRGRRIGSEIHESILRVDYLTKGTIDVGQLDVLQAKEDMSQVILRD
jgi:SNF2 family DNA or RNA helicase